MIAISPDYFRRLINAGHTQVVGEDIPPCQKRLRPQKRGASQAGRSQRFDGDLRGRRLPLRLDRMERGQGKDRGKVTHIASIINGVYVTGRMAEPADLRGDLVDAAMKL